MALKHHVIITPDADEDLRAAFRFLRAEGSPQVARAWLNGIKKKIESLSDNPQRAHGAPDSGSFDEPIRELLYGSGNRGVCRILFTVFGRSVFILHVRHGSMLPIERVEFER